VAGRPHYLRLYGADHAYIVTAIAGAQGCTRSRAPPPNCVLHQTLQYEVLLLSQIELQLKTIHSIPKTEPTNLNPSQSLPPKI
jgi:hypothetical protein